jgi:hypothetical protein
MKTSIFSGAFAGAFDCARLVDVNNNPARDCDWARRAARVNGARSIFFTKIKSKFIYLFLIAKRNLFGEKVI